MDRNRKNHKEDEAADNFLLHLRQTRQSLSLGLSFICDAIKEAEPEAVPRFPRDDLLATVYAKVVSRWIATLRCSFVEVFEVVSRKQRRIRKVLPRSLAKNCAYRG